MCLAIPAKIIEIKDDGLAIVDILGISREVSISLLPMAEIGDYILVHAGFGIEIVSEENAAETLELIAEFPELAGLDEPQIAAMEARAQANAARERVGA